MKKKILITLSMVAMATYSISFYCMMVNFNIIPFLTFLLSMGYLILFAYANNFFKNERKGARRGKNRTIVLCNVDICNDPPSLDKYLECGTEQRRSAAGY